MITHISIKDFAIIENVEVDFFDGLNIMTGETGSGKSIVIEAISLALGSRADTAFIRRGCEKATVQLIFELDGDEHVITRELSASGRNICRYDGQIVTLAQLNELCLHVADIHGQYDHQSLLDPDKHIDLLDSYRQDILGPLKEKVVSEYSAYSDIRSELKKLKSSEAETRRQADFMQFEFDEICRANLSPDEDTELESRVTMQQNAEKIFSCLAIAYDAVCGEERTDETPSASDLVNTADTALQNISSISDDFSDIEKELADVVYRLEDIGSRIRDIRDRTVFDKVQLDNDITRLEMINSLKQKYGESIDDILAYRDSLAEKLEHAGSYESLKAELSERLKAQEKLLRSASDELSLKRMESARQLEKEILEELDRLNFENASFEIRFLENQPYTINGKDRIEFFICTNKGEELKPLSRIASGGEMSRIMLAFKKITGDYDDIPSMIFDEIDTGISGTTATVVGRELKKIAENHQIICITHLPQIAACGAYNYRISKSVEGDITKTDISLLSSEEKVKEIARLVGGLDITDRTLANAEELISQSE